MIVSCFHYTIRKHPYENYENGSNKRKYLLEVNKMVENFFAEYGNPKKWWKAQKIWWTKWSRNIIKQ